MKTKKIKEELDRELDEATPNININKAKEQKITLIDDYTVAAHKKMDRLRYITAGALFLVFTLACFLIITNVVEFDKPQKRTEVTCYVVTNDFIPAESMHIVTKNGVVVERFSLDELADKYMEYVENDINLKDYKGVPTAEYLHNLILAMAGTSSQINVTLRAINNSPKKTEQDLKDVKEEIIRLNVDKKIKLNTKSIDYSAYNDIIKLNTDISDLDSQLEIILANKVKADTED